MAGDNQNLKRLSKEYAIGAVILSTWPNVFLGLLYSYIFLGTDKSALHSWVNVTLCAMGIGCFIGIVAVILNTKRFFKPIMVMIESLNAIADGDLSTDMKAYKFELLDTMKEAFDSMRFALRRLVIMIISNTEAVDNSVASLKEIAGDISTAAVEVAAAVGQVAKGSTEQAMAVQGIFVETRRVQEIVNGIADKTKEVADTLTKLENTSQTGANAIEQQKERIEANRQVIQKMNTAILDLSGKSQEIGNILEVINNIAGQTNLLALNASIEAARSGEQGRGFQVVAQEVRKLAEESSDAGHQIGQLIADIQSSVDRVVRETRIAGEAMLAQEKAIGTNQTVVNQVADSISLITGQMDLVVHGIDNIVESINKINSTVSEISIHAEDNSARVEEVASTAEEQARYMQNVRDKAEDLERTVHILKSMTNRFKLPDGQDKLLDISQKSIDPKELALVGKVYRKKTIILVFVLAAIIGAILIPWSGGLDDIWAIIWASIFAAFTGLVVAIVSVTRNIKKFIEPAAKLVVQSDLVANGDLSNDISSSEDMGKLDIMRDVFNKMVHELRGVTIGVEQSCEKVQNVSDETLRIVDLTVETAEQVGVVVNDMASGSTDQATKMMDVSDLVRDMFTLVEGIASNASQVAGHTAATENVVAEGVSTASFQRQKVDENMEAINRVADAIEVLEEKSVVIGQIIKVISDIAGETNLLALNAAIEAARAGESGRGFAVVAEEVRKLAEETAGAAHKISDLIDDIQNGTKQVVADMDTAQDALKNQIDAVLKSQEIMEEVNKDLIPINKQTQMIAQECQVITVATENISDRIQSIAAVSEETAAATEEVLASSEEQQRALGGVKNNVHEFSVLINELHQQVKQIKVS
ncbi:MAG: methyl-accepting chemotaxis protein [Acidobacteriota bacterium]